MYVSPKAQTTRWTLQCDECQHWFCSLEFYRSPLAVLPFDGFFAGADRIDNLKKCCSWWNSRVLDILLVEWIESWKCRCLFVLLNANEPACQTSSCSSMLDAPLRIVCHRQWVFIFNQAHFCRTCGKSTFAFRAALYQQNIERAVLLLLIHR